MVKDPSAEVLFCDMIRLMSDDLKESADQTVLKTTTINRIILKQLIEYIAVHESLKESDVAENVGISGRFLTNIKNDKEPVYISIRRSEEHTSELQSRFDLVCRLLLEKKKDMKNTHMNLRHSVRS